MFSRWRVSAFVLSVLLIPFYTAIAQPDRGSIKGTVVLDATGDVLHHATILLIGPGRRTESDDRGQFVFDGVPPGRYELLAHMHSLTDERREAVVVAGATATVNFRLRLSPVREEITVTASGREETALDAFQSVTSLDTVTLATKSGTSLGEVLQGETGVANRSSGPGTGRPVVRGFDGDRVLILEDGIRTGTLSSQSGDHGEPVDPHTLERVEVVRGPATLLYGSNAIGGVVNQITGHHQHHQHPHEGMRGYVTGLGSSNNGRASGSAGAEYGHRNWLFHADAGAQRSGDYSSPLGEVPNSSTRLNNILTGAARYGDRAFYSLGHGLQDGRYAVPYDATQEDSEKVAIDFRRHNIRFNTGLKEFSSFEQFQLSLNYSDWNHQEREGADVHNEFFNKQFVGRGSFDQKKLGRLTGSFGFWGMHRDYKAFGEEALTPPVKQNAVAAFALEQLDYERVKVQVGARLEHNRYNPTELVDRNFTAFSGAAGLNARLWRNGALVVNYTHSYRAPALEELYANGPHAGNATFEIGNSNLVGERSNGIDASVRHHSQRVRLEGNVFHYAIQEFLYLAPTGQVQDGLPVAEYVQGHARYWGAEARSATSLHPNLVLNLGVDFVSAELTQTSTPLPRIPPVRGRAGVEARYKAFSVFPEVVLADRQDRVYSNENPTAGYATLEVKGTYTLAQKHTLHIVSVNFFNSANRLYRNHLSFIKEFAPEIGRGVLVSYTLRFF